MNFNISKDRKFLQLENTVVDLETGLKFNIENPHPVFICEMFKNQFTYSYKHNLMEKTELFSKMRQLIYPLISYDHDLVSEYEIRYGKSLIFESEGFSLVTLKTIEESWDFIKYKMGELFPINLSEENWLGDLWDKGVNAVKKGAEWIGDKLKQAGQWILNKGLPWFFEKLEAFLLNPLTIGVEVALTAVGVGKIAGAILWGALGIWKIYQLFSGQIANDIWSYLDIGVCLLGLLLTGGAAKAFGTAIKGAGRNIAKVAQLPGIKQLLQLLAKGIGWISNMIMKPIEWLAKNLGGPKVNQMISVAKSKIGEVVQKLQNTFSNAAKGPGIGKTVVQGVKSDIVNPLKSALKNKTASELEKAAFKGAKTGTAFAVGMKGVEKFAERQKKKDEEKLKQEKANADQAIAKFASNDETLKQTVSSDMGNLLNKFKEMDNQK